MIKNIDSQLCRGKLKVGKERNDIMQRNINQARWLTLIMGALACIGSFLIIRNPLESFHKITLILGYATILIGITEILRYFTSSVFTSELPLFKGLINIIFGLIIILNSEVTMLTILILIGFWIFVDSIIEIIDSFRYKRMGVEFWWISLINGIIGSILGILMIGDLNLSTFYLTLVISFKLLSTGLNMITLFFIISKYYHHFESFSNRY